MLKDQRKRAKLQWLLDPSEITGDNLNKDVMLAVISGIKRGDI
jgi:hypothetical protein